MNQTPDQLQADLMADTVAFPVYGACSKCNVPLVRITIYLYLLDSRARGLSCFSPQEPVRHIMSLILRVFVPR